MPDLKVEFLQQGVRELEECNRKALENVERLEAEVLRVTSQSLHTVTSHSHFTQSLHTVTSLEA